VIKKSVSLFQPSMPDMYYILREKDLPAEKPVRYTSFEYDSFPGGLVHEMYPAVAWITPDNTTVGFLTDAGYLNQYSRATRRRFSGRMGGLTGIRRLPDPELFMLPDNTERNKGNAFVQQTYGEMFNLDAGTTRTMATGTWAAQGNTTIQNQEGILTLNNDGKTPQGITLASPLKNQQVYRFHSTILLANRCLSSFSLSIRKCQHGH